MLVAAQEDHCDPFDVLRWVIGTRLGGGRRSDAAVALIGVDKTRGWTQRARWDEVAPILEYKTGDSFRHGIERGRPLILVILDEVTDGLVHLANERGFTYKQTPLPLRLA